MSNWVRSERNASERATDPEALTESERDELRKKNVELGTDTEILRRAAAVFRSGDNASEMCGMVYETHE